MIIEVKHLSKTYENPDGSRLEVLKDVNCTIDKGEVISIIGPSGTGKSTFLRTLNLLEEPTGGEIFFDGENILHKGYRRENLRRKMGMVFQNFNLFPLLTVLENVTFASEKLLGTSPEDARREGMELLSKVGMAQKADVYPDSLSGGQKQRVAIARALAMHPEVILFDEPTSALDPTMVGEVLSVIRQLAAEGMTMLIVTHEMRFARDVSTRIFFMNEGVIYEDGSPQQIFGNPVRSATKTFVKSIHKLLYEVDGPQFDMYTMESEMATFCVKYNISSLSEAAITVVRSILNDKLPGLRPMTVRLTYAELEGVTALDFMVRDMDCSPVAGMDLSDLPCKEIVEEKTALGFRVKVIL